jgi:hypothetical protein
MSQTVRPDSDPGPISSTRTLQPRSRAVDAAQVEVEAERRVLLALEEARCLTLGQLRNRTGLASDELAHALQALSRTGRLRRLNTVIESSSRPLRAERPSE